MTTILTTRTAHWDICRHRRFERNDRQIKTAGGTELQGQLQSSLDISRRLRWLLKKTRSKYTKKTLSKLAFDFISLGYDVIDYGSFNPYSAKVWKFIFTKKFYTTHNLKLIIWNYTQSLVLSKPVE